MMRDNNEHIVDIVGEINPGLVIENFLDQFWEPLTEEKLMQAWLHPETIKVVEE